MKFDRTGYREGKGLSLYQLSASTEGWCCQWLESHTLNAMITDCGSTVYDLELFDGKPWIKLQNIRFCPLCGERFELSSNKADIKR